jgi:methylmalonyl-CoA/ethylmalonyl-CoA epimerase
LLQPVDGPSIYKEWLDEHGEGLHHIAVMRPTSEESEETRRHFEELGAPILVSTA